MPRYNDSAKIEAKILNDIKNKGGFQKGIVYMQEVFSHKDKDGEHMCLVFETLGQSLYDFIKANKFKGMKTSLQEKGHYCSFLSLLLTMNKTYINIIRIFTGPYLILCKISPPSIAIPSLYQDDSY